jgi:hypothetical protein
MTGNPLVEFSLLSDKCGAMHLNALFPLSQRAKPALNTTSPQHRHGFVQTRLALLPSLYLVGEASVSTLYSKHTSTPRQQYQQ